jgi:hypothetical protein
VVATDGVIVQDDVIVGEAADFRGCFPQRMTTSAGVTQVCDGGPLANFGRPPTSYGSAFGCCARRLFDVQWLLAKDPLMKTLQRGTGVDTQIVSERSLQPTVGVKCVVLAFRQIVGRYQLCPQRFSVRVLGDQCFEVADYGMCSAAGYFGLARAVSATSLSSASAAAKASTN